MIDWNIIIPSIMPTMAALIAAIVGIFNHIQGNKIHVLVNSNMTAVKTDLALANDRIAELQKLVSSLTNRTESASVEKLMTPIPSTVPKPL
jgi:hypothetical protein